MHGIFMTIIPERLVLLKINVTTYTTTNELMIAKR